MISCIEPSDPTLSCQVKFSELTASVSNEGEPESKPMVPTDPLKWFGYLTSPALKAAQRDFKDASSCFPALATVMSEMKEVEIEVRRTRKKLSKLS